MYDCNTDSKMGNYNALLFLTLPSQDALLAAYLTQAMQLHRNASNRHVLVVRIEKDACRGVVLVNGYRFRELGFQMGWDIPVTLLLVNQMDSPFKKVIANPRGVRQHCYKKKAATVGQNGRLSALCNFILQNYEAPHIKSQTMRHPLMNLVNTTLSQKYGDP